MDPPELASEPPRSRIGAASNSAPELRRLGWVMLSDHLSCLSQRKTRWTMSVHLLGLKNYILGTLTFIVPLPFFL